jgi:copper chaperone NosL
MTISDNKFGAEILTKKGKVYKYDELHCLMAELSEKNVEISSVKDFYFTDYSNNHTLVRGPEGFYLKSDNIKGPMGGNIAAFSGKDKLMEVQEELGGEEINWNELIPSK